MHAMLSRFSRFRLCETHRRQPTRLPRTWDSSGKNTGLGCHFLLQPSCKVGVHVCVHFPDVETEAQ